MGIAKLLLILKVQNIRLKAGGNFPGTTFLLKPSLLLEMESPDGTSWHIADCFHLAFLQGIGDSIVGLC